MGRNEFFQHGIIVGIECDAIGNDRKGLNVVVRIIATHNRCDSVESYGL